MAAIGIVGPVDGHYAVTLDGVDVSAKIAKLTVTVTPGAPPRVSVDLVADQIDLTLADP